MPYRLLSEFEALFQGKFYNHRIFNLGDQVALGLYEDLEAHGSSTKFATRTGSGQRVVNIANVSPGIGSRRPDGTFGERLAHVPADVAAGFNVKRGLTASNEIGVEVKIVCKAMIRQFGRVKNDLIKQAGEIREKGSNAITVAVVGINYAPHYVSLESDKEWRTTGKGRHKHPFQEADAINQRLRTLVAPHYDELVILPFLATNEAPFGFAWRNRTQTENEYGAALLRVSIGVQSGPPIGAQKGPRWGCVGRLMLGADFVLLPA